MNELETNYIELMVAGDGSVTWKDTGNVYQFSNETTGVLLYTPYSGAGVSALVNVRLPDGTELQEAPMSVAGIEEINGVTSYLWSYDFTSVVTSLSGYNYAAPVTVSFRFTELSGKSKTTNQVKIPVQPSLQGEAMVIDCETADVLNAKIDQVATDLAETEQRVTALENTMVRKVLVDFTANAETGAGVKYYSDGTTASVQFPTGACGGAVKTDWVRVIEFTADSFIGGELAFGSAQTGFTDNKYTALLDRKGAAEYEAGTETVATVKQGYFQTANSFFKGSDGSILLTGVNKPFDGRLVLLGGSAFSGAFVTGASYEAAANSLLLEFVNGSAMRVPLGNAVNGVTFDADANALTFTMLTGDPIVIPLPRPTAAQRYIGTYTSDDWQSSAAPYALTIPETVHARGANPAWQFYNNQYFGVTVAANGDMTLSSNVKKAFTIVII